MAAVDEPYPLRSSAAGPSTSQIPACATPALSRGSAGSPRKRQKRAADDEAGDVVVLTCPGDGVHLVRDVQSQRLTLQTSDQTPLDSHSTGPTTAFLTPALTRTGADGIRRTHIAVQTVDDAARSELWTWSSVEREDGTASDAPTKHVISLPKVAIALSAPEHLPENLIVGYEDGSLSLLDLTGAEGAASSARACTMMRLDVSPTSPAVVKSGTLAVVAAIRFVKHVAETVSSPVKVKGKKRKSAAAVETSGPRWTAEIDLFAVVQGGALEHASTALLPGADVLDVAFDLASGFATVLGSDGSLSSFRIDSAGSVQPVKSLQLGSLTLTSPASPVLPRFLLSLGSSFVLLAARRPEAPESLSLSVWDMRHGVVLAEQTLQIPSAVPGSGSTPADVATTLARLGADAIGVSLSPTVGQGRTISYAASITVPAQSSLVHVVGRQAATARYLAAETSAPRRIVNPLLSASQLAAADAATERRSRLLVDFEAAMASDPSAADAAFETWLQECEAGGVKLPRSFVSRLVAVAMSAGEDVSKSLAIGTLRQLLPRGVVSDSDVADGLALTALRRHDWTLVDLVLIHVHDVPESALAHVLRAASGSRAGLMTPALPDVLARVVNCSTSAAPLRAALRETLRADDLPPILAILSGWLAFWSGLNAPADASGRRTSPPPLDPTLAFAQALLDAHLVALLQDERSREAARELGEAVAALVRLADELDSLRAPLAALALVAKPAPASTVKGVRKSARQTAHELHMAVGMYTRETFDL